MMLSNQGAALGYICSAWSLAVLLLKYCRQTLFLVNWQLCCRLAHIALGSQLVSARAAA